MHEYWFVCAPTYTHYVLAFVCLHFAQTDIGVLDILEEFCIAHVAAGKSFARVLNPQEVVHIVINRQTVSLY